jgi:hypothetical protein
VGLLIHRAACLQGLLGVLGEGVQQGGEGSAMEGLNHLLRQLTAGFVSACFFAGFACTVQQ